MPNIGQIPPCNGKDNAAYFKVIDTVPLSNITFSGAYFHTNNGDIAGGIIVHGVLPTTIINTFQTVTSQVFFAFVETQPQIDPNDMPHRTMLILSPIVFSEIPVGTSFARWYFVPIHNDLEAAVELAKELSSRVIQFPQDLGTPGFVPVYRYYRTAPDGIRDYYYSITGPSAVDDYAAGYGYSFDKTAFRSFAWTAGPPGTFRPTYVQATDRMCGTAIREFNPYSATTIPPGYDNTYKFAGCGTDFTDIVGTVQFVAAYQFQGTVPLYWGYLAAPGSRYHFMQTIDQRELLNGGYTAGGIIGYVAPTSSDTNQPF